MKDLQLIATFAPEGGPGEAERRSAQARLEDRIARAGRPIGPARRHTRPRRRLIGLSAAAVLAATAAVAGVLAIGGPAGGPTVESAAAAVDEAATVTAASARSSGTAVVRITHNGEVWAGSTLRWHEGDPAVSSDAPLRPGAAGSELRVVGGPFTAATRATGVASSSTRPRTSTPAAGRLPTSTSPLRVRTSAA
jgi:hypothetical protein